VHEPKIANREQRNNLDPVSESHFPGPNISVITFRWKSVKFILDDIFMF